jgi:putative RNA 2'-phosphotransferase
MGQAKSSKQLSQFIGYVLGRRPDEFGLVTDPEGYVKLKEFFKALHEEDGWKYVRKPHIDEILISSANPSVEIKADAIRAVCRDHLPEHVPTSDLPKLLFTCVRKRAYPFVLEMGLAPAAYPHVILTPDQEMVKRLGRRIDPDPVILTVHTHQAINEKVIFFKVGEVIYRTESLPAGCLTGPLLPKQKAETKKREPVEQIRPRSLPGSFFIDFTTEKDNRTPATRDNRNEAKSTRTRAKKNKRKRERPPWRT